MNTFAISNLIVLEGNTPSNRSTNQRVKDYDPGCGGMVALRPWWDGLQIGIIVVRIGIILAIVIGLGFIVIVLPYLGMITMKHIKNKTRLTSRKEETEKGTITC